MVTQAADETPITTWRLDSPPARLLAAEVATLEDLHVVLQCCERLLGELTSAEPDRPGLDAVVDSLWRTALRAYQRCFKPRGTETLLTEQDVLDTHPEQPDVGDWHRALVGLVAPVADDPGESGVSFTVGVVRAEDGTAQGIAVTSPARVLPDQVVVRSAGTIAYALSVLVEGRIGEHQVALFADVEVLSSAQLDALPRMQAAAHR